MRPGEDRTAIIDVAKRHAKEAGVVVSDAVWSFVAAGGAVIEDAVLNVDDLDVDKPESADSLVRQAHRERLREAIEQDGAALWDDVQGRIIPGFKGLSLEARGKPYSFVSPRTTREVSIDPPEEWRIHSKAMLAAYRPLQKEALSVLALPGFMSLGKVSGFLRRRQEHERREGDQLYLQVPTKDGSFFTLKVHRGYSIHSFSREMLDFSDQRANDNRMVPIEGVWAKTRESLRDPGNAEKLYARLQAALTEEDKKQIASHHSEGRERIAGALAAAEVWLWRDAESGQPLARLWDIATYLAELTRWEQWQAVSFLLADTPFDLPWITVHVNGPSAGNRTDVFYGSLPAEAPGGEPRMRLTIEVGSDQVTPAEVGRAYKEARDRALSGEFGDTLHARLEGSRAFVPMGAIFDSGGLDSPKRKRVRRQSADTLRMIAFVRPLLEAGTPWQQIHSEWGDAIKMGQIPGKPWPYSNWHSMQETYNKALRLMEKRNG